MVRCRVGVRNVGIRALKLYHTKAMTQFLQKIDVFVNLLTGCARSPIQQALPFVFDSIFKDSDHVVVVVSPLVNSIKDKVDKLANLDILVASLNDISEENALGCKKQGTV